MLVMWICILFYLLAVLYSLTCTMTPRELTIVITYQCIFSKYWMEFCLVQSWTYCIFFVLLVNHKYCMQTLESSISKSHIPIRHWNVFHLWCSFILPLVPRRFRKYGAPKCRWELVRSRRASRGWGAGHPLPGSRWWYPTDTRSGNVP